MRIVEESLIAFLLIVVFVVSISGCASNTWTSGPTDPDAAQKVGRADMWTSGVDKSQGFWNGEQDGENKKSTDTSEQNKTPEDSRTQENIK
ncbi:MAG TPA: hypothetical protein PKI66_02990 [Methanobacteriaceae archaeon]|nr:hypothetical protein [Euryarchaeota archaeon]HNR25663.1 hypothetical protein [Methanobacteriaceae archaeon]HNS25269.1 hypothetical protein [Methanobacteriaceae archaeon]